MGRAFALLACLVALITQASSFMYAVPGSVVGAAANIRAQGAAVSGFTGYNAVCQREATDDRNTLRMMVSRWVMPEEGRTRERSMSCGYRSGRVVCLCLRLLLMIACLVEGRQDRLWFGERQAASICQPPCGLPSFTGDK